MTISEARKILFFTPYGEWRVHNQVDAIVAAAMQARDCSIYFVTCDGLYQPCAIRRDDQNCSLCQKMIADTLSPYSFCASSLGALITLKDAWQAETWVDGLVAEELANATYDSLPIGKWALSTAMTHFRISDVAQITHPKIAPIFRRFICDTLLTYWGIDRILEQKKLDTLFLFNGRYYPFRAAFEAARSRGVRILVHERGRIGNSFSFFENENCLGTETLRHLTDAWSGSALDESELKRLDAHFAERLSGRSSNWPSFYDRVQNFDPHTVLDIPDDAKIVGFFSSSYDEIASLRKFDEAMRQFELIENIARAIEGTDIYLVVRHHPHIAGADYSTVEVTGFYEAYRQAFKVHRNVRTVMPRDDFASYALFPYLTAAITPFSSIATELVAFGIPTLVANISDARFDERFVLNDWSPAGAIAAIDFIVSKRAQLSSEDMRHFYRKFYATLFRFSKEFKVIGIRDYFQPATNFQTIDALLPGQDATLDRICDHLLTGQPVYEEPTQADALRSPLAEDLFVSEKIGNFSKRRQKLKAEATEGTLEAAGLHHFAVLIDETLVGPAMTAHWRLLPHAQVLSIQTVSQRWFTSALSRPQAAASINFHRWSQKIARMLESTKEDYVLVANARFQFHDIAVIAISEAVKLASSSRQPVIALAGWIRDPEEFAPVQLQPVKIDLSRWKEIRQRLGASPQDTLSSAVVRRDWLSQRLTECMRMQKSSDMLEGALFDATIAVSDAISLTRPVFLLS